VVWLSLVAATLVSWRFGQGFLIHGLREAGIAILVIAFIKIRYVILDFMEIRRAPLPMRIAAEIWVVAVCTTMVLLYDA
jgi:hypothetical protein